MKRIIIMLAVALLLFSFVGISSADRNDWPYTEVFYIIKDAFTRGTSNPFTTAAQEIDAVICVIVEDEARYYEDYIDELGQYASTLEEYAPESALAGFPTPPDRYVCNNANSSKYAKYVEDDNTLVKEMLESYNGYGYSYEQATNSGGSQSAPAILWIGLGLVLGVIGTILVRRFAS